MPNETGQLVFRRTSGCTGCLALPFSLIGPLIWFLAYIHPPHANDTFFSRAVFPFLIGLAFTLGPLAIGSWREWVVVDPLGFQQGSGPFKPSNLHRVPVSGLDRIAVLEDSSAPSRERYSVLAQGSGSLIHVTAVSTASEAETVAQRAGALTGLPVERFANPADFAKAAVRRVRASESTVGPSQPIEVEETAGGLELHPPPPGLVGLQLVPITVGLGLAALGLIYVVLPFATGGFGRGAPEELNVFRYIVLGLMTLVLVVAPAGLIAGPFLLASAVSIRITAFPGGLRVRRSILGIGSSQVISRNHIQRIDLWNAFGKPAGIEIQGDNARIKLRTGTSLSELEALRDQIRSRVGMRK